MDVRAKNRGRPHRKVRFSAATADGEKLFDPGSSGRKGHESTLVGQTKLLS